MTKEDIETRISDLTKTRNDYFTQAQAQLNTFEGAIQEAQHWLEQINKPTES